jgi:hypothetical protein
MASPAPPKPVSLCAFLWGAGQLPAGDWEEKGIVGLPEMLQWRGKLSLRGCIMLGS